MIAILINNNLNIMPLESSKKIALITGASRGLGYAVAAKLAAKGINLVICSRTNKIFTAQQLLQNDYPNVDIDALEIDLTDPSAVASLFQQIEGKWGKLDICINNVGFLQMRKFIDMDYELWQQTIQGNLTTCYLCCQHSFQLMAKSDEASAIVNISSLSGIRACEKFAGMSPYIASKHAVVGLTESLAVEGKPYNISVNCIAPGSIDTDMFRDNFPEYQPGATADEVADVVLRFCDVSQKRLFSGTIFELYCNA
jgi:NAD(P)-dependent dehydrogenase (short-subunit alcohol dehydrogenase family)